MALGLWHTYYWFDETTGGAVTAPTLAVADLGTGLGATATISGGDSGATNTIYTQAFDGALGTAAWTTSGSRVGNGAVTLSLGIGHYLAVCKSVQGDTANFSTTVYFVVTSTTTAILYQILLAVRSRIQALLLDGIANASVVVKKLPMERTFAAQGGIALPCVLITPQTERMPPLAGTNIKDDITYGVLVTLIASDNQEKTLALNLDRLTLWRERIAKAFRNQRLPGVDSVITASAEPADTVIPAAWAKNLLASAILLRFTSREARGLT
mgnify:CR=1 FL=1